MTHEEVTQGREQAVWRGDSAVYIPRARFGFVCHVNHNCSVCWIGWDETAVGVRMGTSIRVLVRSARVQTYEWYLRRLATHQRKHQSNPGLTLYVRVLYSE